MKYQNALANLINEKYPSSKLSYSISTNAYGSISYKHGKYSCAIYLDNKYFNSSLPCHADEEDAKETAASHAFWKEIWSFSTPFPPTDYMKYF